MTKEGVMQDQLGKYYYQTAYVVEDLDAAERWFASVMGVPTWVRSEVEFGPTCTYRGQPADSAIELALGFSGDVQIELILPLRGEGIHREFLQQNRTGLHHTGFVVPNFDDIVTDLVNIGCRVISDGVLDHGEVKFSYMECGDGFSSVIEVVHFGEETTAGMEALRSQSWEIVGGRR